MARAAQQGRLDMCEWLYNEGYGKDVIEPTSEGFTALHVACTAGRVEVIFCSNLAHIAIK